MITFYYILGLFGGSLEELLISFWEELGLAKIFA